MTPIPTKTFVAEVRKAIEDTFSLRIEDIELSPSQGKESIVFFANLGNDDCIVIKISQKRNAYPFEMWSYKALEAKGAKSPKVLFYSPSLLYVELPCLVLSKTAGIPLFESDMTGWRRTKLLGDVARFFALMHSIRRTDLQTEAGSLLSLGGAHLPLQDIQPFGFENRINTLMTAAMQLTEFEGILNFVKCIISNHNFESVLIHCDLGPDHILVENEELSGIIDAGNACFGPVEYDLSYFSIYSSEQDFMHLLAFYGGKVDMDIVHSYMSLICMEKYFRAKIDDDSYKMSFFSSKIKNVYARLTGIQY